jgi:hypothetical protein
VYFLRESVCVCVHYTVNIGATGTVNIVMSHNEISDVSGPQPDIWLHLSNIQDCVRPIPACSSPCLNVLELKRYTTRAASLTLTLTEAWGGQLHWKVSKYVSTTPFRVLHNLSLTIYSHFIKMSYSVSSIERWLTPAFYTRTQDAFVSTLGRNSGYPNLGISHQSNAEQYLE